MGQIANRMLIEVIFKAKEKLKEKRKTKIENSQKMMENRRNRLSKSKEKGNVYYDTALCNFSSMFLGNRTVKKQIPI